MMQKHRYNDKINSLKAQKHAASPDEQLEIDFFMFGMRYAFGDDTDQSLHEKRMELYYSPIKNDILKGKAYRKGMDTVLYNNFVGKKKETGTVMLSALLVTAELNRGLNNLKDFFKFGTLAPVRKAALRWYIEMMSEKHGKDFFK